MQPGDVVAGRFELERRAGVGGMGEVFRAHDRASGAAVALKVLLEGKAPDGERFEREAQALAELSHPAVVRYVTHGVTPAGAPYLAMEWLEGEDLQARLSRGRLSAGESVVLGARVAEALGVAHARGIVHRDLKPGNLFLVDGRLDRVKLLDFGVARVTALSRMTQSGVMMGTPGYLAPEQARSRQTVDARADVFALGCVLFECLTGAPAFLGDTLMATLAKVLFEEAPRARDLRADVPEALDALVGRMLAKEPEQRPHDGAAVAAALRGLREAPGGGTGHPAAARPAALTDGERRALSVVLLGRAAPAVSEAETLQVTEGETERDALRAVVEGCGGTLEHLADGSAVVTIAVTALANDQAAQAARCALALREHAAGRRIALATGYGATAARTRLGDVIDRAARLLGGRVPTGEGASGAPWDAASVAIDDVTAGLLDARFEVAEAGDGLWLRAERPVAAAARTLLGKPTACVGRDRELSMLEQLLGEVVEDQVAHAVLVTAPAGVGKSRLVHELLRRQRQRGALLSVWFGRGDPMRAGSAFGLLGQALRDALGVREGDPPEARRALLVEGVAARVGAGERQRVAEFLGELIGAPLSDEGSAPLRGARLDATLLRDQTRRAFQDFLAAECSARPVVIVLEDLHWGDLPTLRFIDAALRDLKDRPWMVLAPTRPEVHELFPGLWAGRRVQEIRLRELHAKAGERLVRQVLGERAGPETVQRIVAQADGNAFYLEELIRATVERRGEALPETVMAMVQSRLAALDGDARQALRAASVFGEVFWPEGVRALLGGAPGAEEIAARLARLVELEVLVQRPGGRFPGEDELAFRHALLREGAHAMLTDEDRALGHRLAGEWLESRGERDPLVLAEHFERGQDPARAAGFYLQAAEQAHQAGDTDATIARARRGLASGAAGGSRIPLLGLLSVAHVYRTGALDDAASAIEELMREATPGSVAWTRGATARSVSAMHRGDRAELAATMRLICEAEPPPDAVNATVLALSNGVLSFDAWGQLADAARLVERIDALVAASGHRVTAMIAHAIHAMRAAHAGDDPWRGLVEAEAGAVIAEEVGYGRGAAICRSYLGMNLWFLGAHARAEQELAGVTVPDEELGAPHRSLSLAGVLADRGDLEGARRLALGVVESAQRRRHRMDEGRARCAVAEVRCREGDLDAAEREARAAMERLAGVPLHAIPATATLARILLAGGRPGEALAAAEEAMALLAEVRACGMFRGAAVRLVHAEARWAAGRHDAARAALGEARAWLAACAERIGDPELRRSFLEDVPENARTLELAREWLGEAPPRRAT